MPKNCYNHISIIEGGRDIMETVLALYEGQKGFLSRSTYVILTEKRIVYLREKLEVGSKVENIAETKSILYSDIKDITLMLKDARNTAYQIRLVNGSKERLDIPATNKNDIEHILDLQGVVYYKNQNERELGSAKKEHNLAIQDTNINIKDIIQRCSGQEAKAVQLLVAETGWDVKKCKEVIAYEMRGNMLQKKAAFIPTKTLGVFMAYDEKNNMLGFNMTMFNGFESIYHIDEIVGYELIEDETVLTKGGLGKAALGGLIFGSGGAIVGSILGKKVSDYCTSLKIRIVVDNISNPTIFINFINGKVRKDSIAYKQNCNAIQECLSLLDLVTQKSKDDNKTTTVTTAFSEADEILKFKKLLDEGIITKEEFDIKKKQLLGL